MSVTRAMVLPLTGDKKGVFGNTLHWEGSMGYPVGDAYQLDGKVKLKLADP